MLPCLCYSESGAAFGAFKILRGRTVTGLRESSPGVACHPSPPAGHPLGHAFPSCLPLQGFLSSAAGVEALGKQGILGFGASLNKRSLVAEECHL
eukprot:c16677_g1_i1 orf=62-346(+)